MLKRSVTILKIILSTILKIVLVATLLSIVIFIGVKVSKGITTKSVPTNPVVISQVKSNIVEEKVLHKETIVSKFKNTDIRQIMQTTVSHPIIISEGNGEGWFKNDKIISYNGIGKFLIDKSKITSDSFVIDNTNKTITMFTSKPVIEVELFEEKTQFQDDKGKLVFWDITPTPEESEKYRYDAKEIIKTELSNVKYDDYIISRAKEVLESILKETLIEENCTDYTVNINFVVN